jgi:flagellin
MSRINSNVPAIISQRHLTVSQRALNRSLERLSSGLKINRGADDPAGLIVSERLRADISTVKQAINNSSRAINVIATTEGALNEVAALLTDIKAKLVEAANSGAFSDEEIDANQLQVDSSIDSITRIANTTTFAGRKLLNGSLDYVTSGVSSTRLADVKVLGAKFGSLPNIPVTVNLLQSAQQAALFYSQPTIASAVTFDLEGPDGVITLTFPANASSVDIVQAINQRSDDTGVVAVASGVNGASGFRILSNAYGSDAFVSVRKIGTNAGFTLTDRANNPNVSRSEGRNADATVNGVQSTSQGLKLQFSSATLKVNVTLTDTFGGGGLGTGTSDFVVTNGGALFQLGPSVQPNLQENIGVQSVQANKLGDAVVGFLSQLSSGGAFSLKSGQFQQASKIVEEAITQVAVLRGRLGSFERNTLQTNISQLQITAENLTSAESVIRDTDFAVETSELTRSQILVQAGNSILAIANAQSQNVLTLLGQ